MSETRDPRRRRETSEERARRIRKQRLLQERRRKRRRKALMLRAAVGIAGLLLVIGIVSLVVGIIRKPSSEKKKKEAVKETEDIVEMEAVDVSRVLHLSFDSLIAVPETAFQQEDTLAAASLDQGHLTVDEFNKILQQLYDQGYVLVSIRDLMPSETEAQDTGDAAKDKTTQKTKGADASQTEGLMLPKGKKPLLISQRNVSYDLSLSGQGFASRIILDGNGKITTERVRLDGNVVTGDFDVVSCVDTFVSNHPDFSHGGARGILGLTGYNGILGYRTDETLGATENNKYASKYGIFDTAQEIESVKPVIEALKAEGWEFACNGYGNVSYNSGLDEIKSDMKLWQDRVGKLVGDVDILLYPFGTDIGNWSPYDSGNEKYEYLKEQGFRYFSALTVGGSWTQSTEEYLRCNYLNLDGYRMYQDLYQGTGRFAGVLDFTSVYDQTRPSVQQQTEPDETDETDETDEDRQQGEA
ncbi:MAG: hypothetical protein KH828_12740 [Clostridiales bacterium]|nr:hypothetical protein [Clostridiales bacterium]